MPELLVFALQVELVEQDLLECFRQLLSL